MTAPRSKRETTKRNPGLHILPGSPLERLLRMIAAAGVAKADTTRDSRVASERENQSRDCTSSARRQA